MIEVARVRSTGVNRTDTRLRLDRSNLLESERLADRQVCLHPWPAIDTLRH